MDSFAFGKKTVPFRIQVGRELWGYLCTEYCLDAFQRLSKVFKMYRVTKCQCVLMDANYSEQDILYRIFRKSNTI